MAVHDHKAPARLQTPPGDTFTSSSGATHPASCTQAASPCLSTLDDLALAAFALSRLLHYNACCGKARVGHTSARQVEWPLPPLFEEGLTTALQCLQQYAGTLGHTLEVNA